MKKFSLQKHIIVNLLKILAVLLAMVVLFTIGLLIGYGMVGKKAAFDVFRPETWQHLFAFLK